MKVLIFSLIISCLFSSCAIFYKKNDTENCGGFKSSALKNKSKLYKAVMYGKAVSCYDKYAAPRTLIGVYDEHNKLIDSVFTDNNGLYKLNIRPGTYKIRALQINAGSTESNYLDFNPQDSTKIDLFLGYWPSLKD